MYAHLTYQPVDWNRHRSLFFKIALIFSIALCFCILQIEVQKKAIPAFSDYEFENLDLVKEIPRTMEKKKVKKLPPPPTPKPKVIAPTIIKAEDPKDVELEKKIEQLIVDEPSNNVVSDSSAIYTPEVAPKLEIVEEKPDNKPVRFAERMPVFGDCNDLEDNERKLCSDKEMLNYIYKNLEYPDMAREIDVSGTVVLQFVISEKGSIQNVKIIRDLPGGCGVASKKVLERMPQWFPGKQNGRPVSVLYTIPIKFELQ